MSDEGKGPGAKPAADPSGGLIGEYHRQHQRLVEEAQHQQRRRRFVQAVAVALLAVAFLAAGWSFKLYADHRRQDDVLLAAKAAFSSGTAADLEQAATELEAALHNFPEAPELLDARALVRAQQLAEFGEHREQALEAIHALADPPGHDGLLAKAMVGLETSDLDGTREALEAAEGASDEGSLAPEHEAWIAGMLALADPDADVPEMIGRIETTIEASPTIALRRVLAALRVRSGDGRTALEEIAKAREQSRAHMGLAADEALYNALIRQKLGGVADVADQLLGEEFDISPRDRARALLARGVVHVHSGELKDGLERVGEAWERLPEWDLLARELALEMVLEAGDTKRAREWIEVSGLVEVERETYRAWALLVDGDVMGALTLLAGLPQEHERVALLQALALVEQRRLPEAQPWLDRVEELSPGRVDVEVARARVEVATGDAVAAMRKLEALAEEEPYAPRAWTGLGEACLAVSELEDQDRRELRRQAMRAFGKAAERERRPAEAHMRLAELEDARRGEDASAPMRALEHLEKAVELNQKLPRYAERHALYLAELGFEAKALEKLEDLVVRPGVGHESLTVAVELALSAAESSDAPLPAAIDEWIDLAEKAGADAHALARARAHRLVAEGDKEGLATARDELAALLDERPDDATTRILYARALLGLFEREDAASAVRRGLASSPAPDHGRLYLEWARIESRMGSRRKAAAHARLAWNKMKAESRPPRELLEAAALTTRLMLKDRKTKPALSIARDLTERLPFHTSAFAVRANVELKANQTSEARLSAEKAIELDEDNPRAHELLGHCLVRFGHRDRAKEAYERAIELATGTPDEKQFRESLSRM